MTTLKSLRTGKYLFILFCSVFVFTACKKNSIKKSTSPVENASLVQWSDLLYQLDLASNTIIVEKEGSIQEALDVANPGDIIYLEPGKYRESLRIDKPIKLIGLTGLAKDQVIIDNIASIVNRNDVQLINIQLVNGNENITTLPSSASVQSKKKHGILDVERIDLGGGIAHYVFEVGMGSGQFDVVRLHRVVREHRPFHPVHTTGEVFMVHGASQDFDDIFLTAGSSSITGNSSSPVYLAAHNIDVWGIDLAWTLVPIETTDFTFMKNWGVEHDVDHVLRALSISRLVRGLTRQGLGRLNLLGFSYGATVMYTAAGKETQQHPLFRDIKGIIPVDGLMKYSPADETSRLSTCAQAAAVLNAINNGVYQNQQGVTLAPFGNLAISAPADPSPIIPGLTNFQAGLFAGTSNYAFPNPLGPFWHFIGGDLSTPASIPNALLYTDHSRWFRLLTTLAPYQPQLTVYESRACNCNQVNVTIDDYLDEISVPIFYLGAGGGYGTLGDYTTTLTASADVTKHNVSLQPATSRFKDYGHADLFMGINSNSLVWQKLHQWLVTH